MKKTSFLNKSEKRSILLLTLLLAFPFSFFLNTPILHLFELLRIPSLNQAMILLGNFTEWFIILAVLIAFLLITEKHHLPNYLLSFFIAISLAFLLKYLLAVPRPSISLIDESGFSFPSGHATAAFVSLPYLIKSKPKLKALWITLALIIAISRVYIGVHYPSDVLAGAIIGLSSAYSVIKS
jgi:undecaprenyl-diphosphatase